MQRIREGLKRIFLISACVLVHAAASHAQSPSPARDDIPVKVQLPNSDISAVLKLYASLTNRKVSTDPGLAGKVTIFTPRPIPRGEAVSLIRSTLLQHGIEIREVGESEAFVSRVSPPP